MEHSHHAPSEPRSLFVTGALVLAIALLAIGGWVGHWPWLTTWLRGGSPMVINTALSLAVSALGLIALGRGRPRAAMICGSLVAAFAGLVLAQFIFDRSLGVDEIFWRHSVSIKPGAPPGRMAMNTAVALVAMGLALALMTARRENRAWLTVVGVGVLTLAVLPLLNYLALLSDQGATYRGMSLPTMISVLLFALAILRQAGRAADGRENYFSPVMAAAVSLLIAVGVVSAQSNTDLREAGSRVVQAHLVQASIERVVARVARMETNARGYVISGQEPMRTASMSHRDELLRLLDVLEGLVVENPAQATRARELRRRAIEKIEHNATILEARRTSGGLEAPTKIILAPSAAVANGMIALGNEMKAAEELVLVQGEAEVALLTKNTRAAQIFGSLVALALVGLTVSQTRRSAIARLAAEAAVRESEERFRTLAQHAPVGIFQTDAQGGCLYVNERWQALAGLSPTEAAGESWTAALHPEDRAAIFAEWQAFSRGQREFALDYRFQHRDGRIVWVTGNAVPLRDAKGATVGYLGTVSDITARKELDQSLAAARDQAVEASRLKSEFLATMSHEIRTPMNGVIGMAALLRDTPLSTVQADYVRTIESSGESLLTIINDILDFSKIEAGRIDLEVTEFDLRQPVEDALDLFAERAAEKKIELAYLLGTGVPARIASDVTRLRQILVNLLGNAVKFTATGEVLLTVECEAAGDRQRLKFAVKDTGIGISAEGMARLFKSFSQVDASTTRRFGGTGLGLAISRRLAELMGGTVWAESQPGEGSVFSFSILVDPVENPAAPANLELQGRHLLIISDQATNRRVVSSHASTWGMIAEEVSSAEAALALLATERECDIAVVDADLPEMAGGEFVRALRGVPGRRPPQLVLLTALRQAATAVAITQTVAKPIKADALRAAISAALRDQPITVRTRVPFAPPSHDPQLARRCPLRLLVAEDNAVNQRVANLLLQRLGYQAVTVANGLEAVAAAADDYDAILMDVEMPLMDGREACRKIRELSGSPTRPWIIALTAGAMQGDRERSLGAGMNDFLTKPVRPDALSSALERAHAGVTAPPIQR